MTRPVNGNDGVRRVSKRQRIDPAATNGKASLSDKVTQTPLQRFTAWTTARGIFIDPRLDLRSEGDAVSWSISIHAAEELEDDQVVVTVPKSAVISRATSALAPHLKGEWRSESSQTVGLELALCLLYERCLGVKSRFEPFISVLPRLPVQLPFLGHQAGADSEDETSSSLWVWMQGTEADRLDKRAAYAFAASSDPNAGWLWNHDYGMCKDMALNYFDTIGVPVLEQSGLFDPTQCAHLDGLASAFLTAYTHVSSRDFIVDTYHGVGLVPVADLFNHTEEHNVQFEADQEVCEFCGIAFLTGHTEKHCTANPSRISTPDAQDGESSSDEDQDFYGSDTLDIRTRRQLAAGEEMFNTYGALSNALLLTRYGFCLDTETDMDRYTFDLRFPDERAEFIEALSSTSSVEIDDVALKSMVAFVLHSTKSAQVGNGTASEHNDDDDDDDNDELSPDKLAERDGLDGLYTLDRVFASVDITTSPLNNRLCPLFRLSRDDDDDDNHSPPGIDEDTVDRDTVNPLFIDATGRISTVLFALVFLLHHRAQSGDAAHSVSLKALLTPLSTASTDTHVKQLLTATTNTLITLLQRRLDALYIASRADSALDLLQSPTVSGTTKSCIQHAYQEYTALRTSIALLIEMRSP